jgi:hypothetical protein
MVASKSNMARQTLACSPEESTSLVGYRVFATHRGLRIKIWRQNKYCRMARAVRASAFHWPSLTYQWKVLPGGHPHPLNPVPGPGDEFPGESGANQAARNSRAISITTATPAQRGPNFSTRARLDRGAVERFAPGGQLLGCAEEPETVVSTIRIFIGAATYDSPARQIVPGISPFL